MRKLRIKEVQKLYLRSHIMQWSQDLNSCLTPAIFFATVLGSLVSVSPPIESLLTSPFPRDGNEIQETQNGLRPKVKCRNSLSPAM